MATLEICQHIVQLLDRGVLVHCQHARQDMVRAGLVGRVEVARLSRRPEWTDYHSGRIGMQK
jgi:hypothetical protein